MTDKQIDDEIDNAEKAIGDGMNAIGRGARGFNDEFMEFLKKYQVIGLAVAVVIGTAATKLVNSTVTDLIMPLVAVVTPSGNWKTAVLGIGPLKFLVGDYLSAIIDFMIIALVIFLAVKYLMKGEMGKKV
ncbi:MAG: MscL family protein [Methanoregula sp.]|nr:MscL family protein [Methanoregula sp.]